MFDIVLVGFLSLFNHAGQQRPTCDSPEFRQFDFWVGSWDVTSPDGKPAGTNQITRELKDCVLHEHWQGAGGGKGESFNIYDRASRKWHQTWVADAGEFLLLDGGLEGSNMVLSGRTSSIAQPGTVLNRITWTPTDRDHVRQLWEASRDGGKTWSVLFDGRYVRKS